MKSDEYSLSEIRFQGNWWNLPGLEACSTLKSSEGIFGYIWSHWNCHGVGRCDFYYSNGFGCEIWVNFPSILELMGFGQSVISSLPPHPWETAYTEFVE